MYLVCSAMFVIEIQYLRAQLQASALASYSQDKSNKDE